MGLKLDTSKLFKNKQKCILLFQLFLNYKTVAKEAIKLKNWIIQYRKIIYFNINGYIYYEIVTANILYLIIIQRLILTKILNKFKLHTNFNINHYLKWVKH